MLYKNIQSRLKKAIIVGMWNYSTNQHMEMLILLVEADKDRLAQVISNLK
jgi:hypothetical protein